MKNHRKYSASIWQPVTIRHPVRDQYEDLPYPPRDPADEARRHLPMLIERWRRTATWPQLWTTLRLVAESIRAGGHADVALLVLAAADCDPAAPTLVGDDLARIEQLRAALEEELGPAATGIVAAAGVVDRVAVLDRAIAALTADVSTAPA